jgi:hypothetical protein
MSLTTFRRIFDAHRNELDERGRLELDERVGRWCRDFGVLRNSWSDANSGDPRCVARALRIDFRAHVRAADDGAPIFRALRLRFGEVLRLFERAKRHAVHKKTPLFELVAERGGQRAVLCDEPVPVSAGEIAEAALTEPSMRAFRAWSLGYLAMRGTCPSSLGALGLGAPSAGPFRARRLAGAPASAQLS